MKLRTSFGNEEDPRPVYPLRVLRLEPATDTVVLLLHSGDFGVLTHHTGKRSVYCSGSSCNPTFHKINPTWKGYLPVLEWKRREQMWVGQVLEITESLDRDWGDVRARGQVWRLFKEAKVGKKHPALQAEFIEERPLELVSASFDIEPCLKVLYHVAAIDLGAKNPMPRREIAVAGTADAPPPKAPESDNKQNVTSRGDAAYLRKALREKGFVRADVPPTGTDSVR